MRLLLLLMAFSGMSIAGYFGMYEVMLEVAMVTVFLLDPDIVLSDGSTRPKLLDYLPARVGDRIIAKRKSLSDVIKGDSPAKAVSHVILLSIAFGCGLAALWIFWNPWKIVVARELIEIVLDLFIFSAAFFLFRAHFKAFLEARKKTEQEQAAERRERDDRDEAVDRAMQEEDSDESPPGALSSERLGRGMLTMGERLDMIGQWAEITKLGGKYEYFRDDRRAEMATEDRARWETLRNRLYKVRMVTMLAFCIVPYALGWAANWFFVAPNLPAWVARHLWGSS
jgi:hypothetical protein